MRLITLSTDFQTQDGYVGAMKGVIWSILRDAQIADITHQIQPQNVLQGAFTLNRSLPYFPPETVHIAVVDPGVGTARRPIAARVGNFYVVGPDNGLFSLLFERFEPVEIYHLTNPAYWLADMSNVFHGRDIFAPSGAHLARGVPLAELGTPISDPVMLHLPVPEQIPGGWQGEVIQVDAFGSLGTNLDASHLPDGPAVVKIAGAEIRGISRTFGERPEGELVALIDSDHQLAVGVVNGNAAARLNAGPGTKVSVVSA